MRRVIFSMTTSLDGYIAGPGGDLGWSAPDEELFLVHTERVRETGVHLLGRRLYETMVVWETWDQRPTATELELEFAGLWKALPKIVFSTSLESVEGNTRLARDGLAEEVTRLKQEPGRDIEVGGAALAASLTRLGLIDEYQMFVCPVVLGAGTPYFPAVEQPIGLDLVETRTFAAQVVYLRYVRVG